MARPVGHAKTGGRKKGTPNKKATVDVLEKAKELGVDPFEVLLYFTSNNWQALGYDSEIYHFENAEGSSAMGYVITPNMRLLAAKEACKYMYPVRKAIEVSIDDENNKIEFSIEEIQLKDKIKQGLKLL